MNRRFFFLFLIVFFADEINAYFDPGTGSLLVQSLVATVGGVILFFKNITFKIKNLVSGYKKWSRK